MDYSLETSLKLQLIVNKKLERTITECRADAAKHKIEMEAVKRNIQAVILSVEYLKKKQIPPNEPKKQINLDNVNLFRLARKQSLEELAISSKWPGKQVYQIHIEVNRDAIFMPDSKYGGREIISPLAEEIEHNGRSVPRIIIPTNKVPVGQFHIYYLDAKNDILAVSKFDGTETIDQ
jgi:hypothetical protein